MKHVLKFCELFEVGDVLVNSFRDFTLNGKEDNIIVAKLPLNVTIAAIIKMKLLILK